MSLPERGSCPLSQEWFPSQSFKNLGIWYSELGIPYRNQEVQKDVFCELTWKPAPWKLKPANRQPRSDVVHLSIPHWVIKEHKLMAEYPRCHLIESRYMIEMLRDRHHANRLKHVPKAGNAIAPTWRLLPSDSSTPECWPWLSWSWGQVVFGTLLPSIYLYIHSTEYQMGKVVALGR